MIDRRSVIRGLAALPLLGAAACGRAAQLGSVNEGAATTGNAGTPAAQAGALHTRLVPGANEQVPVIGIGTARRYADPEGEEQLATLRQTIARFVELGGKMIDTAPSYGRAEEVLGRLIEELGVRERLFLATKVAGANAAEGQTQIAQSFRNLRTGVIDLIALHNPQDAANKLAHLRELKAQGRVRSIGASFSSRAGFAPSSDAVTSTAELYADFEALMRRERLDTIQVDYALDNRGAAERVLPLAQDQGLAVMVNLPFGRGRLFQETEGRPLPDWAAEIGATTGRRSSSNISSAIRCGRSQFPEWRVRIMSTTIWGRLAARFRMQRCGGGWSSSSMPSETAAPAPRRGLSRLIVAEPHEVPAVLGGFLLFFLLFASYFMLRPVRETFGIAGGVDNLQWLYLGTFLATLVVVPIYGAGEDSGTAPAATDHLYFLGGRNGGFGFSLMTDPDNVWIARAFYIWLSVFNLFVISIAWSLMADVFNADQGHRLFGQIAAGASLGGLTGPMLSGLLVAPLGHAGLLLVSTGLLLTTLFSVRYLIGWRERQGDPEDRDNPPEARIGGSIWAGLGLILRSPYLLGISAFVLLLTSVSTFLYFEQARVVEATFPDRTAQTQVFSAIDFTVQSLTIFIQIFVTGRLTRRLGVTVLLAAVPVTMMFGFGLLALVATFPVLVFVMIVRRVGEYALVRPGREMLFTNVDAETKYKAKNAIDTFVYRGGDVIAAWANVGIVAIGTAAAAAVVGAFVSAVWTAVGWTLGRRHDREADHLVQISPQASGTPRLTG
jgi:ATP:ADP antiporter, AAA family